MEKTKNSKVGDARDGRVPSYGCERPVMHGGGCRKGKCRKDETAIRNKCIGRGRTHIEHVAQLFDAEHGSIIAGVISVNVVVCLRCDSSGSTLAKAPRPR